MRWNAGRPTSAHEHVFLLTKKPKYFYDAIAVQEQAADSSEDRAYLGKRPISDRQADMQAIGMHGKSDTLRVYDRPFRNLRNVWHLGPEPFPRSHFAVFPSKLVEPCIKAGTSERGCCAACGAPWMRVIERSTAIPARNGEWKSTGENHRNDIERKGGFYDQASQTLGWHPSCHCNAGEPIPCTVLDPFAGAGTVGLVADRLGRNSILIELNADYAAMARSRLIGDAPLFANVVTT